MKIEKGVLKFYFRRFLHVRDPLRYVLRCAVFNGICQNEFEMKFTTCRLIAVFGAVLYSKCYY